MTKTTVIKVYDEIGGWGMSFAEFERQLSKAGADVELRIHSPGGDAWDGMAMASAIRSYDRGKVLAVIEGLCASAAGFLAAAADERAMHAQSLFMIHEASCFAFGRKSDLLDAAGRLDDVNKLQAEAFAKLTGKPLDEIMMLLEAETWYTPAAAKQAGFVDRVIDIPARSVDPQTMAQYVARFRNAPSEWAQKAAPYRTAASVAPWQHKRISALSEPTPKRAQQPTRTTRTAMQSKKDLIGVMAAALALAMATAQEASAHADEDVRKLAGDLLDDDVLPKAVNLVMPLAQAEKVDEEAQTTAKALIPVYSAAKKITGQQRGLVGALEALKRNAEGRHTASIASQCDALIKDGVAATKFLPSEGEEYKAAVIRGERTIEDMESWVKSCIPRGKGSSQQVQEKPFDPKNPSAKTDDDDDDIAEYVAAATAGKIKGAI